MTPTTITMTVVQLQRYEVLSQLNSGTMNDTEAGEKLGLSVRHIRRLKKMVEKKGASGLIHGDDQWYSQKTRRTISSLTSGHFHFAPARTELLCVDKEVDKEARSLQSLLDESTMGHMRSRATKGDKREIREETHLTRPPRMEGAVKEAMMKAAKKPKKRRTSER